MAIAWMQGFGLAKRPARPDEQKLARILVAKVQWQVASRCSWLDAQHIRP
jgi:hypothetical protein